MEQTQDLVFYDRYEQTLKTEAVYGEKPLRWANETRLGGWFLEAIIKRRWFSALYGRWADCACSASEIAPFIERFRVDPEEFRDPPESFRTFNEFFHRRLKPGARPLPDSEKAVCFPADGRHLLVPDLSRRQTLYAKGQRFDLAELLGDPDLAERYQTGTAVISRLCPTDYHRFHFPLGGTNGESKPIDGSLYSVNPIALARQLGRLWKNKRRLTVVSKSAVGDYLFLEIGATNVGSMVETAVAGARVATGDEKGYFRFGGSMIVTIFPPGSIVPSADLAAQSAKGVELYARCGDEMAALV
ncbi:MAG: phosphatidylserine decarboxylase [Verrucomicrobiales bacterium]